MGGTPLVEFGNIKKSCQLKATILAKLEGTNPAGSAKDRVGREMIAANCPGSFIPGQFENPANAAAHTIQGIGAGFAPEVFDTDIYDEILTVNNEIPFEMAKEIAKKKVF